MSNIDRGPARNKGRVPGRPVGEQPELNGEIKPAGEIKTCAAKQPVKFKKTARGAFLARRSRAQPSEAFRTPDGLASGTAAATGAVVLPFASSQPGRLAGSYGRALYDQRIRHAGPARLLVGFSRILLVVENWPSAPGWFVLDYFPLTDPQDRDLHAAIAQLAADGYGRHRYQTGLAPTIRTPRAVDDPEAIAAVARLVGRGMAVSIDVASDMELLRHADGGPARPRLSPSYPRRSRTRNNGARAKGLRR